MYVQINRDIYDSLAWIQFYFTVFLHLFDSHLIENDIHI